MKVRNKVAILSIILIVSGCMEIKKDYKSTNNSDSIINAQLYKKEKSILDRKVNPSKLESQCLISQNFKITLPLPFHLQKENYEEGVFYVHSFSDSAYIIVFEGAMSNFDIDKYPPERTYNINKRKITVGKNKNKFWRKDKIETVRVYYNNVVKYNKKIYDAILDSIKISQVHK